MTLTMIVPISVKMTLSTTLNCDYQEYNCEHDVEYTAIITVIMPVLCDCTFTFTYNCGCVCDYDYDCDYDCD